MGHPFFYANCTFFINNKQLLWLQRIFGIFGAGLEGSLLKLEQYLNSSVSQGMIHNFLTQFRILSQRSEVCHLTNTNKVNNQAHVGQTEQFRLLELALCLIGGSLSVLSSLGCVVL